MSMCQLYIQRCVIIHICNTQLSIIFRQLELKYRVETLLILTTIRRLKVVRGAVGGRVSMRGLLVFLLSREFLLNLLVVTLTVIFALLGEAGYDLLRSYVMSLRMNLRTKL